MGFEEKDDDEEFEEKMERLTARTFGAFQEIKGAGEEIKENLAGLGYEI